MKRINIKVAGTVQGVGFRFFARSAARRAGVSGFVRNLADGRVEAEAQGSEESLSIFVNEVRQGPDTSMVTEVTVESLPVVDTSAGFEIRF